MEKLSKSDPRRIELISSRKLAVYSAIVLGYCVVSGCRAQAPLKPVVDRSWIECVKEFPLPAFSAGPRPAWLGGRMPADVVVTFQLSKDGHAEIASISSPTPELGKLTARAVTNASFDPVCDGKRVRLTFTYETFKPPIAKALPQFTIRGPDHFILQFLEQGVMEATIPAK